MTNRTASLGKDLIAVYSSSPSTSGPPEPFPKFAGANLEDFLFDKAIECFADGWSLSEVQERVSDWHVLKAAIGAVLSDEAIEAIVARAEREVGKRPARVEKITRPGYTGRPLEVEIYRG